MAGLEIYLSVDKQDKNREKAKDFPGNLVGTELKMTFAASLTRYPLWQRNQSGAAFSLTGEPLFTPKTRFNVLADNRALNGSIVVKRIDCGTYPVKEETHPAENFFAPGVS